jgi:hypothetical protein
MKSFKESMRDAQDAKDEILWQAIKTQNSEVLISATQNRNLIEDMALYIAKNKNTPPEALGFLATDIRFKESNRLKLALCKNPRSPHRMTIGLLKFLSIFDMADLSRNKFIPTVLRQRVEVILLDKVGVLPTGMKIALSRRASERVVEAMMNRGERRVIDACLESSRLTEERVFKLITKPTTKAQVIRAVSEHPKWSVSPTLRYALVRNFYTAMQDVDRFIHDMNTMDLKNLYSDSKLPSATRPFIFRELRRRGEGTELPEDVVYELKGNEDKGGDFKLHSEDASTISDLNFMEDTGISGEGGETVGDDECTGTEQDDSSVLFIDEDELDDDED